MKSSYLKFKTVKFLCIIMTNFYCSSLYLMFSEIQRNRSTFVSEATKIRNQELARLREVETAATVQRFWELNGDPKIPKHLTIGNLSDDGFRLNASGPTISASMTNLWGTVGSYSDRILEQLIWAKESSSDSSALQKIKMKKIMLISTFRWWNFKGNKEFQSQCPGLGQKCEFVDFDENRTTTAESRITKAQADAIITVTDMFHLGDINMDSDVLRFFYILESNYHAEATLRRDTDILSSYLRTSNVVTPYAKWVYYDHKVKGQKQDKNYASAKTKIVAVVMSFCDTINNRMNYINELQKYIQVDIYGDCGNLTCDRTTCMDKLRREYKFYLAFENSNCRDYITEKFFGNALGNDMVPVVMGAHPDDYKAVAPHHSYIHVEDFGTPADLANYLMYLHKNDYAYNLYFSWKGTGEFIDTKFLCRVCAMTHYGDLAPPPERTEVFQWEEGAETSKLCLPKSQMYWKRT